MRVFAGNHNIIEITSVFILYCGCFQVFIILCIPMFYNIAGIHDNTCSRFQRCNQSKQKKKIFVSENNTYDGFGRWNRSKYYVKKDDFFRSFKSIGTTKSRLISFSLEISSREN